LQNLQRVGGDGGALFETRHTGSAIPTHAVVAGGFMKLIKGDCLEVMKDIPDKSIDMILCDLPYGTTACKWDVIIPFEPLWKEYKRIIKDNRAIVLTASQPFTSALVNSNLKMFKYEWIWEKTRCSNPFLAKHQPLRHHENIVVFSKNKHPYYPTKTEGASYTISSKSGGRVASDFKSNNKDFKGKNGKDRFPKSVIKFSNSSKEAGIHPTQKPVTLLEYLIKTYTLENETVLDNCMGSGSTGVACINTNRNFIGIEKDDKYFEIAKNRIEKAQQDVAPKV